MISYILKYSMTDIYGENILLIGKNLTSLPSIPLPANVKTINVHCNNIEKIEGTDGLLHLEHLDVSSNKLTSTDGLNDLISLKFLNLASNFIHALSNFENLTRLVYLNLSYNKLESINGLIELHGPNSHLETIELHGNNLTDVNHVIACLQGIISLKHLVLQQGPHNNPICHVAQYRQRLLNCLPQLQTLDHLDRMGIYTELPMADDLSSFDEFIFDENSIASSNPKEHVIDDVAMSQLNEKSISTPHIDAVLAARRSCSSSGTTVVKPPKKITMSPEQSLTSMEVSTRLHVASPTPKKQTQYKNPLKEASSNVPSTESEVSSPAPPKRSALTRKLVHKGGKGLRKPVKPKKAITSSTAFHGKGDDVMDKTLEKQTYVSLLKELESERERRWKAEQASRKLVTAIRDMQAEQSEGKSLQNMAADAAERLKKALLAERDISGALKQENQKQTEKIEGLEEKLAATAKEKMSAIRTLQNALSKSNVELSKLKSVRSKEKQEMECKLCTVKANQEALNLKNEQLQTKLNELQNLLVNRETEYKKSLSGMYSMDNCDFRKAIELHSNELEKRHNQDIAGFKHKVQSLQHDYSQLENEFREALYIESERYKNLSHEHYKTSDTLHKNEDLVKTLQEKEEKSRSMVVEMTSIIKEQKAKIIELLKCKEEVLKQYKDRIFCLEQEKEEGKRNGIQLELLKQEKSRLLSQLTATQSVVDGLKEQRKVWGRELAHQGSALAQDRGRLEMKIETLEAEISNLRKGNERDLDALRIKTKVVEDQTETIHKLKEALVDKDKEVRVKLEEELKEQRCLRETIEDLTQENASLQEENLKLNERKQQLKNIIGDANRDHDSLQVEYEKLKKKWIEKGALLSKLEHQVKNITEAGKQRETKVAEERDDAIKSLQVTKKKTDQLVAAYEEQLKLANGSHVKEMERFQRDKREEIERMQNKVVSVENEMSDLLREAEEQKKQMNEKMHKLKSMFHEFS
ncbi:unnamed protein product [Clavelina lepadiformis]|uniref:Leucine-rich repeat and coiled-coil domain-containing protein 1 n=1 Tax=Clavelina lepadiformis TaxID=159417 RepID=A0ABP0FZM5_CLALP